MKKGNGSSRPPRRSALDDLTSGDSDIFTGHDDAVTPEPDPDHTVWPNSAPDVPDVPKPPPPPQAPPQLSPPLGGDVGGRANTNLRSAPSSRTGSYSSTAAEIRHNAIEMRTNIATCEYNVSTYQWQWCNVVLPFEGGRKIPYEQARTYATTLYETAWKTAVIDAVRGQKFDKENCNEFVWAIAKELGIDFPGINGPLANDFYDYFAALPEYNVTGWQSLREDELNESQAGSGKLSGLFVVGASHSVAGSGNIHGHVVLAAPNGYPPKHDMGEGPWCIDAKRAEELRCFHASRLFYPEIPSQLTQTIWAVYRP